MEMISLRSSPFVPTTPPVIHMRPPKDSEHGDVGGVGHETQVGNRPTTGATSPLTLSLVHATAQKGWSVDEASQITEALQAQQTYLLDKKAELELWNDLAKRNFNLAFGTTAEADRQRIMDRINAMLALNAQTTPDNFEPADPQISSPGLFAYVYPNDPTHTIYLGPAFWESPTTGVDSRAGTIAHEMSHFDDIGDTDDGFPAPPIYGRDACRQLALERPDLAVRHADSFQYYLERAHEPNEFTESMYL